jgi:hypothetical protein
MVATMQYTVYHGSIMLLLLVRTRVSATYLPLLGVRSTALSCDVWHSFCVCVCVYKTHENLQIQIREEEGSKTQTHSESPVHTTYDVFASQTKLLGSLPAMVYERLAGHPL